MRKISLILLATSIVAAFTAVVHSTAQSEVGQTHSEWIARSLKEIETIKTGMTRADLLKVFREEGGVSTRIHRQYVYRDCPYIKVSVEFEPVVKSGTTGFPEEPGDKIVKISRPFLEWSIID